MPGALRGRVSGARPRRAPFELPRCIRITRSRIWRLGRARLPQHPTRASVPRIWWFSAEQRIGARFRGCLGVLRRGGVGSSQSIPVRSSSAYRAGDGTPRRRGGARRRSARARRRNRVGVLGTNAVLRRLELGGPHRRDRRPRGPGARPLFLPTTSTDGPRVVRVAPSPARCSRTAELAGVGSARGTRSSFGRARASSDRSPRPAPDRSRRPPRGRPRGGRRG